jgi:hypothetical protein
MTSTITSPNFLAICGAAGTGNTFLLECLTADPNTYGIDEDGFGSLLHRLITSESKLARCPHSISAFQGFLNACRGDAKTLIFKTPANLKYLDILSRHLDHMVAVTTLREPFAAISSGMRRHHRLTLPQVMESYKNDLQRIEGQHAYVVCFEDLVMTPTATLQRFANAVMPLHDSVFCFAERNTRRSNLVDNRWQQGLDAETCEHIQSYVSQHGLVELYNSCRGVAATETQVANIVKPSLTLSASEAIRRMAKGANTRWRRLFHGPK